MATLSPILVMLTVLQDILLFHSDILLAGLDTQRCGSDTLLAGLDMLGLGLDVNAEHFFIKSESKRIKNAPPFKGRGETPKWVLHSLTGAV